MVVRVSAEIGNRCGLLSWLRDLLLNINFVIIGRVVRQIILRFVQPFAA